MPRNEFAAMVSGKLKELLIDRRCSQVDLAKRTGISEVTISRYVNGTRVPDSFQIVKIAKALDTNVGNLLGDNNDDLYKYICRAIRDNINTWTISRIYYLVKLLATRRPPY